MNKEELFNKGNEAVRDALADAIIIINSKGDALTRSGESDKMFFSPMIDCNDDKSMLLFDTEDDARKVIEDYLTPQDGDESYLSIKISKFDPETGKETTSEISTDGETITATKNGEDKNYTIDDIFSMLNDDSNTNTDDNTTDTVTDTDGKAKSKSDKDEQEKDDKKE